MKLSFSTNAFTKYSVWEAVEAIAACGYAGVELLADVPHLFAPAVTDKDLDRLERLLGRTGLKVASLNANTAVGYYGREFWEPLFEPSLANPEPAERRWRIDYSKRCIDMAHRLGCDHVSVTSGRLVSGTSPEISMELLRGSLLELLDHAEKREVRLGIEYEPGLLVERYEELNRLLSDLDSPRLGVNLDLGHSHVLHEDPETVLKAFGSKIFHIHLEDIRGAKHYHLIPGEGDMDFKALFRLLERYGYRGFATVELYTYPHRPEDAARQALDYLKTFISDHDRGTL